MERETPSAEAFLGQLVRARPTVDDIPRQNAVASLIVDQINHDGSGDARLVEFPEITDPQEYPSRFNVVVEKKGAGTGTKEKLLLYGHFDVVKPSKKYQYISHERSPYDVVADITNASFLKGLGVQDMQSGNVAIRESLRHMQLAKHRDIIVVLTADEEGASRGFHAAYHSKLFDGVHCAITPEILVNPNLLIPEKSHALIRGRPGRFGMKIYSRGIEKHAGAVSKSDEQRLTESLDQRAREVVKSLKLNRHPKDSQNIAPEPRALNLKWGTETTDSLTVPAISWIYTNVHYWDPNQGPDVVAEIVRAKLRAVADQVFHDQPELAQYAFRVTLEERPTPFTPPWIESADNPFVKRMRTIMNDTHVRRGGRPDRIQDVIDEGVADCGLIAHYVGCPVVGTPLRGFGAHEHTEAVFLPDIEYVSEVMSQAAAFPGSLSGRSS